MRKKISCIAFTVFLVGAIFLNISVKTNAKKFELSPKANVKAGSLSKEWKTKKTTTQTSYTPITKTYKTVVDKYYDQAADWYTSVKSVSDNFHHKKGKSDLHATKCIGTTHTFSANGSKEVENWTVGLGYSYSASTSKSVTCDIDPSLKTGYYYFGVKAHARDFRIVTKTYKYKKKKGKDYLQSSSSHAAGSAALYGNPLYYNWYKSKK